MNQPIAANPLPAAKTAFRVTPSANRITSQERERCIASPGFGRVFTEHMVSIRWDRAQGWHDGELQPYAALQLDPAAVVLHYSQTVFEGLKAFLQPNGQIAVFRVEAHAARFRRSARRLALPELPDETFIDAVELLIRIDAGWVPSAAEDSLYLRPFMFGNEIGLGARPASDVTFMLIASPSGSYFPRGVNPMTVWLSEEFSRAFPGGTGEAKCGGNYAASLLAQAHAAAQGCDQVVWLDPVERAWIEEMGAMNIFFVFGHGRGARLVTPALTGTLLPGITRDSLLSLGRDLGYRVEERRVSVAELRAGCADGALTEVFASGTAAIVAPVGAVKSAQGAWTIADGEPGKITMRLRQALIDIQRGAAPDVHGWLHRVSDID